MRELIEGGWDESRVREKELEGDFGIDEEEGLEDSVSLIDYSEVLDDMFELAGVSFVRYKVDKFIWRVWSFFGMIEDVDGPQGESVQVFHENWYGMVKRDFCFGEEYYWRVHPLYQDIRFEFVKSNDCIGLNIPIQM